MIYNEASIEMYPRMTCCLSMYKWRGESKTLLSAIEIENGEAFCIHPSNCLTCTNDGTI